MKKIVLAILLLVASTTGYCQLVPKGKSIKPVMMKTAHSQAATQQSTTSSNDKIHVVYGRIDGRDTILVVYLPEVDIDLMSRYYEIIDSRQGRRLVSNVRKVFPYAKLAGDKLKEFDTMLADIPSEAERKHLMKEAEKQLSDQYTEELKKLTFSQGAILIRLIDRETGSTSYKLVQELRGKLRAFFYQGFARLWGYNLKTEYDPKNNPEDEEIEIIATLLERGQI
ncbi:MAG: DUF4294 domain-containing protein [Bacteroidales bacterium]|nr:DUF4294 domain-containing protein [Bacteroidales bacterium]